MAYIPVSCSEDPAGPNYRGGCRRLHRIGLEPSWASRLGNQMHPPTEPPLSSVVGEGRTTAPWPVPLAGTRGSHPVGGELSPSNQTCYCTFSLLWVAGSCLIIHVWDPCSTLLQSPGLLFIPTLLSKSSPASVHLSIVLLVLNAVSVDSVHCSCYLQMSSQVIHTYVYRNLPSKCPPPFLKILWFTYIVYVCIRYTRTYKWLLHVPVSAHPRLLAREFQAPMGTYLGECGRYRRRMTG